MWRKLTDEERRAVEWRVEQLQAEMARTSPDNAYAQMQRGDGTWKFAVKHYSRPEHLPEVLEAYRALYGHPGHTLAGPDAPGR